MLELPLEQLLSYLSSVAGRPVEKSRLLQVALTHRSFVNESGLEGTEDNERLEFLGDSVLSLIVCDLLMSSHPQASEGLLSKYRSSIVNERSLAQAARQMELGKYIRLGKGEELTQGREKDSILSNTFEAVIAALYLDGGLETARAFVHSHFQASVANVEGEGGYQDFKTSLQEVTQRMYKTTPQYKLVYEGGPDHDKVFDSEVWIGERLVGRGRAKSKKDAEQRGAEEALKVLNQEELTHEQGSS